MTAITAEVQDRGSSAGSEERRPKTTGRNIVLCSDGTGNRGGKARGTNVWAIVNAVWRHPDAAGKLPPRTQTTFYDDGIGSQSFVVFKILGGAFGWGYSRNIRGLYKSLVSVYEPGDDIYLFGFSRGAYTVRGLAGLILKQGILNRHKFDSSKELNDAVHDVFGAYREGYKSIASWLRARLLPGYGEAYERCKNEGKIHHLDGGKDTKTHIRFIGVWDTVGAVGLPFDELSTALNKIVRFRFPDRKLNKNVVKACHAIAIDDERRTFWPVMWDEESGKESERIKQVWFAGMHSNVGGGYEKDQMALVALDWMMAEAEKEGLTFYKDVRARIREDANAHGRMYDSRAALAAYYRYKPRDMEAICRTAKVKNDTPKVHFSALRRAARATEDYAPLKLPANIEVVGTHDVDDGALVQKLAAAFQDTAEERSRHTGTIDRFVRNRFILYCCFLAYSIAIVVTAGWFYWFAKPPAAAATQPPPPISWLFDGITWVLPDFVFGFFKPLLEWGKIYWGTSLAVLALLLGLAIVKWILERRTRQQALDAWREFREKAQ